METAQKRGKKNYEKTKTDEVDESRNSCYNVAERNRLNELKAEQIPKPGKNERCDLETLRTMDL